MDFSSGERQLISFARAIVFDPKILILDEATSHIDTETEEIIQNAINVVKEGRTTFMIAHRLSTIAHADQILCWIKGKLWNVERMMNYCNCKGNMPKWWHFKKVNV